jgi:hypothetical protein
MSLSSDVSPVGWYIGTYQLRFVELADRRKNDLQRRFTTWENTVLVKARSLPEAHRKIVKIGKSHTQPYKGGPEAIDVQWVFEGVIDLLPVYEQIADGAEVIWAERTRALKNTRQLAKTPAQFRQHRRAQQAAARGRVKKRGA